jgi:hypothetical protein
METRAVFPDGSPVPRDWCIMPDHYTNTFTITVRSLRPISEETIKGIIEEKLEVVAVEATAQTVVVRNTPPVAHDIGGEG